MKKIFGLIILLTVTLSPHAQTDLKKKLYAFEDEIIGGNFNSLKELSNYLNDTTFVQEYLGYHNYPNTARGIAIRIISESCLFSEDELKFDKSLTSEKMLSLLNSGKIFFDKISGTFLTIGLTERKGVYEIKKVTDAEISTFIKPNAKKVFPDWFRENGLDSFYQRKNPEILKWIASYWYKTKARFNRYYFNEKEVLGLMKSLTHVDVGVLDWRQQMTHLYEDDYEGIAKLNYLIYWTNHWKDYRWNSEKKYFENVAEPIQEKTKEEILFGLLSSKTDSIALDAFMQLSELDTGRVRTLADEYEHNRYDKNFGLPTFPFRFLKQMCVFTQYCRNNNITYKPSGWLNESLKELNKQLEFPKRFELENKIIENLSLEEVAVVEYHGLVYSSNWGATYSIGRILDKFYSKHWKQLMASEKGLLAYLKKAELFNQIGIIGIVNKYLWKFQNTSKDPELINRIKVIVNATNDREIRTSYTNIITKYVEGHFTNGTIPEPTIKIKHYGIDSLAIKYKLIIEQTKKDDRVYKIRELMGLIGFSQLGEAVAILRKDKNHSQYQDRYWIIENDFGIELNSYSNMEIDHLLKLLATKNEYQVYEYYFKQKGLRCIDEKGNLILQDVYELLKYGVVDAFAGGGGSRRDKGIYELVKLLEIKFNSRLGFPEKFCESEGVYSCNCANHAKAWINFLEKKQLVTYNPDEPNSIANK